MCNHPDVDESQIRESDPRHPLEQKDDSMDTVSCSSSVPQYMRNIKKEFHTCLTCSVFPLSAPRKSFPAEENSSPNNTDSEERRDIFFYVFTTTTSRGIDIQGSVVCW